MGRVFSHFRVSGGIVRSVDDGFLGCLYTSEFSHTCSLQAAPSFLNTLPPVSLDLSSFLFKIIMALSVFPHIDESESAWLLELWMCSRRESYRSVLTIYDTAGVRGRTNTFDSSQTLQRSRQWRRSDRGVAVSWKSGAAFSFQGYESP